MALPILFRDADLIAVHKPSGLLVHRSSLDRGEVRFALQELREQTGQFVYPVHRLDKPTSGVLLFALSAETARTLSLAFAGGQVEKTYLAVVRGIPHEESFTVDHPLREDPEGRGERAVQAAVTCFRRLASVELPHSVDRYPTSRYALVQAFPRTGRRHQIRRHLKHVSHPVIGDVNHGKSVHNRFFADTFGSRRLLLACTEMCLPHPRTGQRLRIASPLSADFAQVLHRLGWEAFC